MNHRALLAFCAGGCIMCVLSALSSCSNGPAQGVIRGTVTLDGVPLEEGLIQLTAIDGRAPTAGAQVVNGKFETRAAITKYRVQIESNVMRGPNGEKPDPTKKVDKYAARQDWAPVALVPDKYNKFSKLELDVQPGVQEPVFDLKSK
jgi:hypothetical protein